MSLFTSLPVETVLPQMALTLTMEKVKSYTPRMVRTVDARVAEQEELVETAITVILPVEAVAQAEAVIRIIMLPAQAAEVQPDDGVRAGVAPALAASTAT
jgi:hypothetical protein